MWKELSYNRMTPRNTSRFRFEQYSIVEKENFYNTLINNYSDDFNPKFEYDEELTYIKRISK